MLLYPSPPAAPIEAQFELALRGEWQERREITTTGPTPRTVVQLIDGDRHLELEEGVPTGRDLRDEVASHRRYRRLLADLLQPATPGVTLAAPPGVDHRRTLVLELASAPGERWQAWFDAIEGRPLRIRRLRHDGAGDHVDEDRFVDFVRSGTRLVPRHVVTWRDGRRVMESWLLERDESTPLPDELFALPDGL